MQKTSALLKNALHATILTMDRWLERVEENVCTRKLFRDGQRILVAVSGGVDSMVLLVLLQQLAAKHHWSLAVAHFNHQLRGRSSDADERIVAKTARKLGLPIHIGSGNVKGLAKKKRISIEMAARELRHGFFAKVARERDFQSVALAHHADDQVENFFLRLLRGSGGDGLRGMNWLSASPVKFKLKLIRPLLNFSKTELLSIATENHISFREDATNAQTDFLRNRVRHELIPQLVKIRPGATETILRSMEIIAAESELSLDAAIDWLAAEKRTPFDNLHVAVQRRCLRLQIRTLGFAADFDLIERLRCFPGQAISIESDCALERDISGTVQLRKNVRGFQAKNCGVDLTTRRSLQFANRKLHWSFQSNTGKSFVSQPGCELFDADKVGQTITLRHWQPGDRFQPIGMKTAVKLQDLFVNQKVPQDQRHSLIVALTANGEVFWVEGLRISEQFKLTDQTRRRLKWYFS